MEKDSTTPYGSWKSPITAEMIATKSIGLGEIALEGADTYWLESRPSEDGRQVIMRRRGNGQVEELTPAPLNVRTRVHEYGGGAYTVVDGVLYFSHYGDHRLYRQQPGAEPKPLTDDKTKRYADLVHDRHHNRLLCVREDHSGPGEAVNTLVALDLQQVGDGQVLVAGNDFYSSPRLSPDGRWLAWLTWNHPNMPWDGTELWLAEVGEDGSLKGARQVAGGLSESVFQPEWSPNGQLYFVSDQSGWWNLHQLQQGQVEPVFPMAAEFGLPQWRFGMSTYQFVGADQIACLYAQNAIWHLALLDLEDGHLEAVELPYTFYSDVRAAPGRVAFTAASMTEFPALIELELATMQATVIACSTELTIDEGYLSEPQAIEFPSEDGKTAHAFYYAPSSKDFRAVPGEAPPLIVMSHGGPTGVTYPILSLGKQYWTSRGFAVLDVNYRGSFGYGRDYRNLLKGQWGVADLDDCVHGAHFLVERQLADGQRLAIRGGSAGGYTTLCALTFRNAFHAGASYFGLSDLEVFVHDTHKFESRYLQSLIGPYPERADLYRARSPIYHVDQVASAMILFQGLDDRIVPPNQAELIFEAARNKGLPVAYLAFEGEGHGFREAENIKRSLEAEFYFYGRIFGINPADELKPVEIDNL
jgi:dipeptidyl aminopeptidase/acylaminoacyl peptidase